ncbi:adenosine deaminase [Vibrio sp. B511a]|nr:MULTISPECIES: adenosine deaminase [Vibrio]MCS0141157.1 adenosine deaminase [Vibrio alginolyticus]MDK9733479.1 adenosine deaminase [Vibrio sp. B511a]ULF89495.1 adenosine deaminase [Vibrio alginolyticus]
MVRKSKKQSEKDKKESEQNAAAVKQKTRRRIEDIMEQREFDKLFDL